MSSGFHPRLAQRLRHARRVVALTGAGISAASGIPTFRDAGAAPNAGHRARARLESLVPLEATWPG